MGCLFCEIVERGGPAILLNLQDAVAFRPHAMGTGRVLVVPKIHYANLAEVPTGDLLVLGGILQAVLVAARYFGLRRYKIEVNVPGRLSHLHFHLIGKERDAHPADYQR